MAFDVLRNLPFLRHVPQRAVEVRAHLSCIASPEGMLQQAVHP